MKKVTIKNTIILIVSCFTVFVSTTVAFATTTPDVTTSATPTVATEPAATTSSSATTVPVPAATTTSSVTSEPLTTTTSGSISIAPDSLLYPLKLMVESVQTTLTFTTEGKAELLVSFANKRLAEANLMTERNKQKLVLSVMQAYVKTINAANEKAQEAATTQPTQDVKTILESIQIIEQSADNFVIKVTGTVPQNISDQLKTVVADQVKKTILNEAVAATQDKLKEANQQVKVAKKQLAIARKIGNDALVKSATDALAASQKSKDDASTLKDQVKAYKKDVVSNIKKQEDASGIIDHERDENDRSDKHKDKEKYHKQKKEFHNQDEDSKKDNHDSQDNDEDEDD